MPERPPVVLVASGLDPSGGAGLAADLRALHRTGVHARPVATCIAVQDSRGVKAIEPIAPDIIRSCVEAAVADGIDAIKVGLVPDEPVARALDAALPRGLPFVLDPVLRATSGDALASGHHALLLAPRATLLTPNAAEARALTRENDLVRAAEALRKAGAANVLVKGGDEPSAQRVVDILLDERGQTFSLDAPREDVGIVRGTGCTLASLSAAHLAQGYELSDAVRAAIEETRASLRAAFPQPGASALPAHPPSLLSDARAHSPEARRRVARVAEAWRWLAPRLERRVVPEVGANLSFLPADGDPARAAALSARCVRAGRGIALAGSVEIGGIHHTARVAAAAFHADGRTRAAMNLRHREELVEAARAAGLVVASFSRLDQPPDAPSSVEWGTSDVITRACGRVPDIVFDLGGPGKEPMLRILAVDPEKLVTVARYVLGAR